MPRPAAVAAAMAAAKRWRVRPRPKPRTGSCLEVSAGVSDMRSDDAFVGLIAFVVSADIHLSGFLRLMFLLWLPLVDIVAVVRAAGIGVEYQA